MSWQVLMEQARKLVHDAKALMDQNQGDKFTQERENQIQTLLDQADEIKARAERARRVEEGVAFFDTPAGTPVPAEADVPPGTIGKGAPATEPDAVVINAEYQAAFKSYTHGGLTLLSQKQLSILQRGYIENQKTLTGVIGVEGGFLVSGEFRATFVEEQAARAMLRDYLNVSPVSGAFLEMPVVQGASGSNAGIYANGIVWTWVNAPMDEDTGVTEPEFGLMRIPIHDATAKTRLGINMVNDAAVNIDVALPRWYGEAAALTEDYVVIKGTGVGQPLGIVADEDITGTFYKQTANSGAVAADDLFDLAYDLEAQYAANASWLTSRVNLKAVRKLKTGAGDYVWQPGLQPGEPDTLLGSPVIQSPFVDGISAGNFAFIYGDFKRYALGDGQRVTLTVLREKYIEELKIGYMGHFRMGGQATVARAFRVLKIKT